MLLKISAKSIAKTLSTATAFLLCVIIFTFLGDDVDSAAVLKDKALYRAISYSGSGSRPLSGGGPLCYPCQKATQCNTGACVNNVCARTAADASVCALLRRRPGLGRYSHGTGATLISPNAMKRPECAKCDNYWQCFSGRCVNNDMCAKNAWVYAWCLHQAHNMARRRAHRTGRQIVQRFPKYALTDGIDAMKMIDAGIVSSDVMGMLAVPYHPGLSSSSTAPSEINLIYVCAVCSNGADCNRAKGELCVRNLCVVEKEDLYYCVMSEEHELEPKGSHIGTVNITLEEGPGGMWKYLLGRRDDCSYCHEWYDCRSERCVESLCVARDEDVLKCNKDNHDEVIQNN